MSFFQFNERNLRRGSVGRVRPSDTLVRVCRNIGPREYEQSFNDRTESVGENRCLLMISAGLREFFIPHQ